MLPYLGRVIGAISSPSAPTTRVRAGGFTLIEVLVAVAIVVILSGMAVLTLNIGGYDDRLHDEAKRLFQLTRIASDDAVFKSEQLGVRFTLNDYTFYQLQEKPQPAAGTSSKKKTKRIWQPVAGDKQLRTREWPDEVEVEVKVDGVFIVLEEERDAKAEARQEDLRPHMIFLSNGEILPDTEVQLRSRESKKAWRVALNEDGIMAIEPLEE